MEESKVTMMRRKLIQDAVDRGESLPLPAERSNRGVNKQDFGYKVKLFNRLQNHYLTVQCNIIKINDAFIKENIVTVIIIII